MSSTAVTPPVTPEVTINNTAAEIKAAIESAAVTPPGADVPLPPSPTSAPAAAPPADWGQIQKSDDGQYQVQLATGEVFKGTADEVISEQAKAHVSTKRWAQDIKSKLPAEAAPVNPAAPTEDPAEAATRSWIMEQMAKEVGLPVEQFKQAVGQMFEVTQKTNVNVAWTDFTQACPDYADTPENAKALVDYLPAEVVAQQRPPTADDLRKAHALALYEKKYAPAATEVTPPTRFNPPLIPSAGAGTTQSGEQNPYAMPIAELRKAAFQQ